MMPCEVSQNELLHARLYSIAAARTHTGSGGGWVGVGRLGKQAAGPGQENVFAGELLYAAFQVAEDHLGVAVGHLLEWGGHSIYTRRRWRWTGARGSGCRVGSRRRSRLVHGIGCGAALCAQPRCRRARRWQRKTSCSASPAPPTTTTTTRKCGVSRQRSGLTSATPSRVSAFEPPRSISEEDDDAASTDGGTSEATPSESSSMHGGNDEDSPAKLLAAGPSSDAPSRPSTKGHRRMRSEGTARRMTMPPQGSAGAEKQLGVHRFNEKPKAGIKHLLDTGVLRGEPRDVADFLRHAGASRSGGSATTWASAASSRWRCSPLHCALRLWRDGLCGGGARLPRALPAAGRGAEDRPHRLREFAAKPLRAERRRVRQRRRGVRPRLLGDHAQHRRPLVSRSRTR